MVSGGFHGEGPTGHGEGPRGHHEGPRGHGEGPRGLRAPRKNLLFKICFRILIEFQFLLLTI